MDRITGKQVESIIEAYASVNGEIKEKEVVSEEVAEEVVKTELVLENDEYEKLDENLLQLLTRNRTVYRRDPKTGEKIKVVQQRDPKNLDNYDDKKTTNTGDFGSKGKPELKTEPKPEPKADPKPAANPNVTKDGTKFERRLPTMDELRAAQAARKAAAAAGKDKAGQEAAAVKGGVSVSQKKPATTPPSVSADKPASAPAAKPAMTAAGNKQAELAALRAKAKADTMKKKPEMGARNRMRMEEVDVFDTIKEYLIGEGATEEEALQQMLSLTDEQRTEILEGSCDSKKKKSKKRGY